MIREVLQRHKRNARAVITALLIGIITWTLASTTGAAAALTIWPANATPAVAADSDAAAVELGVKFNSDVAGQVTGIRFYKGSTNIGTHTGSLWNTAGTRLATATFASETATGWQSVTFATPVSITAGTTYVASYFAPKGHYAYTTNGLASAATSGPLHALASSASGGNGVYKYAAAGGFPTSTFNATNYWVDIAFNTDGTPPPPPPTPPTVQITAPAANTTVSNTQMVDATASDAVAVASVQFKADGNDIGAPDTTAPYNAAWDTTTVANGTHSLTAVATNTGGLSTTSAAVNVTVQNQVTPPPPPPPPGTAALGVFTKGEAPLKIDSGDTAAIELGMKFTSDVAGQVTGVRMYKATKNTGTHTGSLWTSTGTKLATGTFTGETATGWQSLTFATPVTISANTTYVVSYLAPAGHYSATTGGLSLSHDNAPLHGLASSTPGGNGVYKTGGGFPTSTYNSTNYWVDVTFLPGASVPVAAPRSGTKGAGPVLVLTDPTNHFTDYYAEILNTEGIKQFASTDAGNITTAAQLSGYTTVVVGDENLTDDQVTLLSDWVAVGGNLIVMRPRDNTASLLGLSTSTGQLDEGYIKIDGTQAPGAGVTTDTMQYHSGADKRTALAGTTVVAGLYSNATTSTPYAAVTLRTVGSGTAQAFMYDLSRSVVYTRQGNPAWRSQNRDATTLQGGVRPDNQFFGNAPYDPQPDWNNPTKHAIPQADEQQRLLVNMLNFSSTPLARLGYMPNNAKAMIIATGDGHPGNQARPRMDALKAADPVGCSVDDWQCFRMSVYGNVIGNGCCSMGSNMTDAQAASYQAMGFEYSEHLSTNCADFLPTTVSSQFIQPQRQWFVTNFPSVKPPISTRLHCVIWSDWASMAKAEAANGIRLDTTYYDYPFNWHTSPGFFTSSAIPMRFADLDGSAIDVYQAPTQLISEGNVTGQSQPSYINTMLDNALGAKQYYAVITTNFEVDSTLDAAPSQAVQQAAKAKGVWMVSASRYLDWVNGRNATTLDNQSFANNQLSFTVGTPVRALPLMVPMNAGTTQLQSLTNNGTPVTYTSFTFKGVTYALVNGATAGTYTATYN